MPIDKRPINKLAVILWFIMVAPIDEQKWPNLEGLHDMLYISL